MAFVQCRECGNVDQCGYCSEPFLRAIAELEGANAGLRFKLAEQSRRAVDVLVAASGVSCENIGDARGTLVDAIGHLRCVIRRQA